jgi:hypothetical protein
MGPSRQPSRTTGGPTEDDAGEQQGRSDRVLRELGHPEPEYRCINCGARYYSNRIAEMCCTVRVFGGDA